MTIDEAKKEIEKLERYIKMIKEYDPENFEQEAIKLYVEHESVTQVAKMLNENGHRIGNRKVIGKDVSDIIRKRANDEMHEMAQRMFKKNTKKIYGRGWL